MAKKPLPRNAAETWSRRSGGVPRYERLPNVFTFRIRTSSAGFLVLMENAFTAWTGPTDRAGHGNPPTARHGIWSGSC